jgi:hypothetical protein
VVNSLASPKLFNSAPDLSILGFVLVSAGSPKISEIVAQKYICPRIIRMLAEIVN